MKRNAPLFLYGAGGHAKVVLDILRLQGIPIGVLIDDNELLAGKDFMGCIIQYAPVALSMLSQQGIYQGIITIGDNRIREAKARLVREMGYKPATAIHPAAIIAQDVQIGAGTVIMAGVIVNSDAQIGENVILNTGCTVDHDCRLGNAVHISPGAHLGGAVTVGDRTQIGIGASVIPNITIGKDGIVGGGAVVIRDLPDNVTAVGVPARIIHDHSYNSAQS